MTQEPKVSKSASDLAVHLSALGIANVITRSGNVSIQDPKALLDHLVDEKFIARGAVVELSTVPPVPVHRADNPIGALQEWCAHAKVALPDVAMTPNGSIHAPSFLCSVTVCDITAKGIDTNKAGAKRKAAMAMLVELAKRYGVA